MPQVVNSLGGGGWRIEMDIEPAWFGSFEALLDDVAESVALVDIGGTNGWRVEAFSRRRPDQSQLEIQVALAAAAHEIAPPAMRITPLPPTDWLAENRKRFRPLRIGRVFIHNHNYRGPIPGGAIPICLEAAMAFGTGEHGTTQGCLLMLQRLAKKRRFQRIVDMGCGSGILAMVASRLWSGPVLAIDNDRVAVAIARENTRLNGVAPRVRAKVAEGFLSGPTARQHHFDLIIANILARPLQKMAPALSQRLRPGGRVILSGFLERQEPGMLAACRAQGLVLEDRLRIDGWSTLLFRRNPRVGGTE